MSNSSRGAVIVTAILAGTLASVFIVMAYLATASQATGPSASQTLGSSGPRATQVRPADVATPSTPAPAPTARPTASPTAQPTVQPVAVATPRPTTAPAPRTTARPTPASTPRPVVQVTPPAADWPAQLYVQLNWAGINAPATVTLSPSGPINGTIKTTASWTGTFSENLTPHGPPVVAIGSVGVGMGGGFLYLQIEAGWPTGSATMTLSGDITGSYGCPGSMQSMSVPIVSTSGASGSLQDGTTTGAFSGAAACPDGSAPTATFTATASLSPG